MEEGEVDASSTEEEEVESSEADMVKEVPKEDPKPQKSTTAKKEKNRNKAVYPQQGKQNDKKSTKQTKNKNASSRRH